MASDLLEALKSEHKEYKARKEELKFFQRSYEGGKDWLRSGYIFKHFREEDQDYADRLKRAAYFNYVSTIIDIYLGHIYRGGIVRATENSAEVFGEFVDNVDRQGQNITEFMKNDVTQTMLNAGYTFVLVDMPQLNGEETQAEAEAAGLTVPYFSHLAPLSVTNWDIDNFGDWNWMRYIDTQERQGPLETKPTTIVRYWTWTREKWTVHQQIGEDEPALLNEREHTLGEVPVVLYRHRKKRGFRVAGLSAVEDACYTNRNISNHWSLLDEFDYRQAFNILVLPTLGVTTNPNGTLEIGTGNTLEIDPEAGMMPDYISPTTDTAAHLLATIERLVEELYRQAKIRPNNMTRQAESGESKAWDFNETNQTLTDKADAAESGEQEMWRLWQKWQEDEPDMVVKYPDDFNIEGLNQELENALGIDNLGISATFAAEWFKKMVRRVDERLTDEQLKQIDGEIDRATLTAAQANAFDGGLNVS